MATTHIYFEGGARNGTTVVWNLEPGEDVWDDNIFRPPELYRRTPRKRVIGRVEFTVFRYDPTAHGPVPPGGR
ncbi:hypothetical protein [Streptomyces sp. NPDC018031]|uniref:hypothetical protein n=1 Tax=Streptomyces sp. NPDC018031 TaxID=3365033 RepID=UPI00378AEDE9